MSIPAAQVRIVIVLHIVMLQAHIRSAYVYTAHRQSPPEFVT